MNEAEILLQWLKSKAEKMTVLLKMEKCRCVGKVLVAVKQSWSQFTLKPPLRKTKKKRGGRDNQCNKTQEGRSPSSCLQNRNSVFN